MNSHKWDTKRRVKIERKKNGTEKSAKTHVFISACMCPFANAYEHDRTNMFWWANICLSSWDKNDIDTHTLMKRISYTQILVFCLSQSNDIHIHWYWAAGMERQVNDAMKNLKRKKILEKRKSNTKQNTRMVHISTGKMQLLHYYAYSQMSIFFLSICRCSGLVLLSVLHTTLYT